MDDETRHWLDKWQKTVLDGADYEGLEIMHDDWRVVMKEAARAGLTTMANMAEQRVEQLLSELSTRNEASTVFYGSESR
jgi:hypothetical protein